MSYILAASVSPTDAKSFEELSFALMPVAAAGETTYTPVRTEA